jgi:hypothetical protein
MSWDDGDGKVCAMIRDRRTAAQAEGSDFESFQRFVASLRDFERVGLLEGLTVHSENHTGHRYAAAARWKIHPSALADSISTSQRRWLLLRFFEARFNENDCQLYFPLPDEFAGVAGAAGRLAQACEWLQRQGFIRWQVMAGPERGCGQILDKGHEALDHGLEMLTERTPMQNIDQSINVGTLNAGSGDLAIGPGAVINKQVLAEELGKLIRAVEDGPGEESEKKSATSMLKSALAHPLIVSIVGALTGAAIS